MWWNEGRKGGSGGVGKRERMVKEGLEGGNERGSEIKEGRKKEKKQQADT